MKILRFKILERRKFLIFFTTLRRFLYLERWTRTVVKISVVANVPFVKLYFH